MPRARPQCPPEKGRGGWTWKQQGALPPPHPPNTEVAAGRLALGHDHPRPQHASGTAAAGVADFVVLLIHANQVRHRRVTGECLGAWAGRSEGCRSDKHTSRKASGSLLQAGWQPRAPQTTRTQPWTRMRPAPGAPAPTQLPRDALGRPVLLPRPPPPSPALLRPGSIS